MDEIKIPKLNENNYNAWSIRTRATLVQKGFWEAIDPGYAEDLKPNEKQVNEKALTFIFLVVEDNYLDDIADCATAKEAWTILKDIHTKFGLLHTLQILRDFFNVTLSANESISSYLARIMDLHRKVSSCGHGFSDREVALIMLMGLPKSYEGLILNLERDEEELSSRVVKSRLIVEEKKLSRYDSRNECAGEKALKIKEKTKYRDQEEFKKPLNRPKEERKTRCFCCGGWGHIARNCTASNYKNNHAKKISSDGHEFKALFTDTSGKKTSFDWYLDSGATEHMCSDESKFFDLIPAKSKVEIANSEKIEVVGTGNIILNPVFECGREAIYLANVLFVPKLDGNLLSVGRIEEMGMTITFQDSRAEIKDHHSNVILTAQKCGRLYKISEEIHRACFTKQEKIMHRRLGHFHRDAIKKLIKDEPDSNEEVSKEEDICQTCILGKMKKVPFPKREAKQASRPLELIHSDVAVPIFPISKGGSKYVVTFVDDYSRYAIVKPMKHKSQVLEKFIEFKNRAENFHGTKITSLRSDNGGEYISDEFEDFLIKNGISRQKTVPRTPEQNPVAEKMNHTLFDMTRCLLIESGVPKEMWADTITTACYLRNKCPSKSIQGKIPEELWTNKPVKIDHLKVFGCKAYSKIDKIHLQGKLGERSEETVFVGYHEGVKGYKLWNVKKDKFFLSRNVKFDEDNFPFRRSEVTYPTEAGELIVSFNDKVCEVTKEAPPYPQNFFCGKASSHIFCLCR